MKTSENLAFMKYRIRPIAWNGLICLYSCLWTFFCQLDSEGEWCFVKDLVKSFSWKYFSWGALFFLVFFCLQLCPIVGIFKKQRKFLVGQSENFKTYERYGFLYWTLLLRKRSTVKFKHEPHIHCAFFKG